MEPKRKSYQVVTDEHKDFFALFLENPTNQFFHKKESVCNMKTMIIAFISRNDSTKKKESKRKQPWLSYFQTVMYKLMNAL